MSRLRHFDEKYLVHLCGVKVCRSFVYPSLSLNILAALDHRSEMVGCIRLLEGRPVRLLVDYRLEAVRPWAVREPPCAGFESLLSLTVAVAFERPSVGEKTRKPLGPQPVHCSPL